MSAVDLNPEPIAAESLLPPWWTRAEEKLDRAGDWLNPILVKEARQAMKSKQFSITFALLLLLGWFWTALFVVMSIPAVYYAPYGSAVLMGYFVLLTIPLLIVVPYQAFRSLAAEREDGTYELLSITSLSARQIVLGKLGSAILQMIVYYSALAPCIAFTYLLRGVDVVTIAHLLFYTFLASVMLSIIGLMLATVTQARHWQLVLSVLLVILLCIVTLFWNISMLAWLDSPVPLPYSSWQFWVVQLVILSFYASYAALFLLLAAGQISFASENRSTPLRWVLFGQQVLLIGWVGFGMAVLGEWEIMYAAATLSALHWIIVGVFLTAERGKLSPRALRALPQSLLGRMFLTWFNPGGATGYVLSMTCLLGAFLCIAVTMITASLYGVGGDPFEPEAWNFGLCIFGYSAAYLGLTHGVVSGLERLGVRTSMLLSVLLQVLFVFLGCLIPFAFQAAILSWDATRMEYSPLQVTNWMWTLSEVSDGKFNADRSIPLLVFGVGMVVYILHIALAAGEVEKQRAATPLRVREEDRALGRDRPGMLEL